MTPTPNDLARRPRRPLPTPAVRVPTPTAPGHVDPAQYMARLQRARLHPNALKVGLALAALADPATGLIPDERQPTQRSLGRATDLSRGRLLHSLRRLEEERWLIRRSAATGMRFVLAPPPPHRP